MLHELLVALSGYPGGIFVEEVESGVIRVVDNLPFIHASETALLNRLSRLATYYLKLDRFIQQYSQSSSSGSQLVPGLYVRSFCQGLDGVLEQYRLALLKIEKTLLGDAHLTAAYVQTELEEYQLLFPALSSLVDQIVQNKIQGCSILELIYKASSIAVPLIKVELNKILFACHLVFYKELAAWMLHGNLVDKFDEFFICHAASTPAPVAIADTSLDDDLDIGGVTGRQLNKILQLSEDVTQSATLAGSFCIRSSQLPSYIPVRVADKILFVGESVCMFDSRRQRHDFGSLLNDQEDEFARDIYRLSQEVVFDLTLFEEVIDKIRSCVAEQLWTLVVEKANLTLALRTMKDFFLLGRGELFLVFIDKANTMLRSPPVPATQHDVNLAFQHAARTVLLEDDSLLQHFKFEIATKSDPPHGQKTVSKKESGWECLKLTYAADWPLHILFTSSVLDRYNTLFAFLLRIKRVQLQLQNCWALQMHRRRLRNATESDPGATTWWLRNHMSFLVDNLQYYLQVDVIESQFSILLNKIQSTRDFEAIRHSHSQFISSLHSQCFMHMKPISHCLNEIVDLCQSFCGLISHAEIKLSALELSQIENIAMSFQRQSSLLFKLLSSVRSHQTSPHLAQLLLRVDYNKFFTAGGIRPGQPRYQTQP